MRPILSNVLILLAEPLDRKGIEVVETICCGRPRQLLSIEMGQDVSFTANESLYASREGHSYLAGTVFVAR